MAVRAITGIPGPPGPQGPPGPTPPLSPLTLTGETMALNSGAALRRLLAAAASLDFPNIQGGGSADRTVTVSGAALGDTVHLARPATLTAGCIIQAFVTAANTVTIRCSNVMPGPVDPPRATFRVTVMGF
jgi:hypothetical protein